MISEAERIEDFDARLHLAMVLFLSDPFALVFDYPDIRPEPPHFWQRSARLEEARLNASLRVHGFPPITQKARDTYWRELRKGQSVDEDAGGFLMRAWRAAFAQPVAEPLTVADFVKALHA
jgi:hypothetical protein